MGYNSNERGGVLRELNENKREVLLTSVIAGSMLAYIVKVSQTQFENMDDRDANHVSSEEFDRSIGDYHVDADKHEKEPENWTLRINADNLTPGNLEERNISEHGFDELDLEKLKNSGILVKADNNLVLEGDSLDSMQPSAYSNITLNFLDELSERDSKNTLQEVRLEGKGESEKRAVVNAILNIFNKEELVDDEYKIDEDSLIFNDGNYLAKASETIEAKVESIRVKEFNPETGKVVITAETDQDSTSEN